MARNAATRARARLDAGRGDDTRLMARTLAGLFAAGATLALLTVLLPHPDRAHELGLLVIVGNACIIAGLLYRYAARVRPVVLRYAVAWGSTLITAVAYLSAERPSPLVFLYLWVFLYASYFFTRRETVAQISFVGLAYGALLALAPPSTGIATWWLVAMGTLAVAAVLVVTLRDRGEALIAQLYEAARTDPLTGLANRRGFRELLDLEIERTRRSGGCTTVVFGDLDHLQEVNDRSGHQAGDAVLRRTARVLEEGRRTVDVAARVGGEEFALILPRTAASEALAMAERLRCAVARELAAESTPVTISFGIATFPDHGETAAALLRAGDAALYGAKTAGRNRSVVYSAALRELHARHGGPPNGEEERYLGVVRELAEALDLRFSGTARHSETVGRYAEMMARELGLPDGRVGRVRLAGILHDIGKVAVPDAVLHKPGALTDEERSSVARHPEIGAQILEHPGLADVGGWIAAHHERPDGRGYPLGLAGSAIPLEARILAVADAYEAMTSDRAYRSSLGHAAARAELRRHAGTQFDPEVVEAFLAVLDRESDRAQAADPATAP